MMNKYIWGGIGVLAIIAAAIFIGGNKTSVVPESTQKDTAQNNVSAVPTVTYTNDGFFPEVLTVKSGTTVKFVNQSDAPMWVASGNHPTHLLYPEFDAKAPVSKNESYLFTFNKLGTHPYHNHLLLGKYGKIIVE